MPTTPRDLPSDAGSGSSGHRWVENRERDPSWSCDPVGPDVRKFHRTLSGYEPTKLVDLPELAGEFGVDHVFVKDESNRLGLPAFKALGASWAIHRALRDRVDGPVSLVAATDGNHGRAVAHFARQLGLGADIFVPDDVHPTAVQAIRDEGATVSLLPGSYDEAVAAAALHAGLSEKLLLIQDTSWDGYTEVPRWIVAGYSTLFAEIDEQLRPYGINRPDLVVVPTGVGSLLQAAITHYRSAPDTTDTAVLSVEPINAACVLASINSDGPVTVATGHTVMAGLNCGTMSSQAWPFVRFGLDAGVTTTDSVSLAAGHDLSTLGVDAGPCGSAALAAVRVAQDAPPVEVERRRALLNSSPEASIVLLVTEGAGANPKTE